MGVGVDDTRMRVLVPYALVGVAVAVNQIGPTQLPGCDRIPRTCQGGAGPDSPRRARGRAHGTSLESKRSLQVACLKKRLICQNLASRTVRRYTPIFEDNDP